MCCSDYNIQISNVILKELKTNSKVSKISNLNVQLYIFWNNIECKSKMSMQPLSKVFDEPILAVSALNLMLTLRVKVAMSRCLFWHVLVVCFLSKRKYV